jgi:peroxiredoxin
MVDSELNFGVPNIELPWNCGGTVNPSCFVGHQLVVLFLPVNATQRAAEFAAYEMLADEFAGTDAWFLTIADRPSPGASDRPRIPVAVDRDGGAWRAFAKLAEPATELNRDKGAAFLFSRGGAFRQAWPGQGHAREVMDELLSRV